MKQRSEVLILAHYQEIGALMAALVELSQCAAHFPLDDESPMEAVRRIAPEVILLEWDHEHAGTEGLRTAAEQAGSTIMLFSPARSEYELEQIARRCKLRAITFPVDRDEFCRSLHSAIEHAQRCA